MNLAQINAMISRGFWGGAGARRTQRGKALRATASTANRTPAQKKKPAPMQTQPQAATGGQGGMAGIFGGGNSYPLIQVKKSRDPWDIYRKIFGQLRQGASSAIRQEAEASKAETMQSLMSRGLGGTTVRENFMTGINRQTGLDIASQRSRLSAQAMGFVPGMTPEPAMTESGAHSLGMTAGMGQASGQQMPEWFRRIFGGGMRSMNMPQRMSLSGR